LNIWEPAGWRPWIGTVIVSWAEVHIFAVAILLVAVSFQRWTRKIPAVFEWLRHPPRRLRARSGEFDTTYLSFLHEYQERLHSKIHSTASSFILIALVLVFLVATGDGMSNFSLILSRPLFLYLFVFALGWAYFWGLAVWPLYVTVRTIRLLSHRFELDVRPRHPDGCGGLQPLGDFCFAMSLSMLIGGLVLAIVGVGGVWLFSTGAGDILYWRFGLGRFDPSIAYLALAFLFVLDLPLAVYGFLVPLWDIHVYMEERRREAQDQFADYVATLEQRIVSQIGGDGGLEEARVANEKLTIIQEAIDPNKSGYPVWPFKHRLLITLFAPQALSIGGTVITFIVERIANAITGPPSP
jgi:hypothetical protein